MHSFLTSTLRRHAPVTAALVALLPVSAAAQAQAVRYIHAAGNDANACTYTAPCRSLQRGINAVSAGGEVRIMSSGVYGNAATINKALTISGGGNSVLLAGPLTVNAAGATVALDHVTLNGRGVVGNGLVVSAAGSVHIVGCTLERFADNAFYSNAAGAKLSLIDSVFRSNGSSGARVHGDGNTPVTVENSRFENNGYGGLDVIDSRSAVSRSTFAGNGVVGFFQRGGTASVAWSTASNNQGGFAVNEGGGMQLESVVAQRNSQFGIIVEQESVAVVSGAAVAANGIGIKNLGTTRSRGNNTLTHNTTDLSGNPVEAATVF